MKFTQTTITPTLATEYLKRNIDSNRPLNKAHIEKLAADIREGRWQLLPHGIVFDTNNRLIDGQHRLHAIVAANKAVPMVIAHDAKPKTLDAIDTGAMRGIHDLATITGRIDGTNAIRYASRARVVRVIQTGSPAAFSSRGFSLATFDEVMATYRDSMDWSASNYSAPTANSGTIVRRFRSALVMGALVVAHHKSPGPVEKFAAKADSGIGLTGDDPAYALRKYLDTTDTLGGPGVNRIPAAYATLKAAYAAIHGQKLSTIRASFLTRDHPEFIKVLKFFGIEDKR